MDNLFAVFLVEFLDKVHGVVGVQQVDIVSDLFRIHPLEDLLTVLFIEFHQDVGARFPIRYKVEKPFRLSQVQLLEKFGNVGRVHTLDFGDASGAITLIDHIFDAFDIFMCKFLHSR